MINFIVADFKNVLMLSKIRLIYSSIKEML